MATQACLPLVLIFTISATYSTNLVLSESTWSAPHDRHKRDLGQCSWGSAAMDYCYCAFEYTLSGYIIAWKCANPLYQCDQSAGNDWRGRCCSPKVAAAVTVTATLGKCSWGADAVSACLTNSTHWYCGLDGYQCDQQAGNDGKGRCCARAGTTTTVTSTSSTGVLGKCSWGAEAVSACFKNSTHWYCGLDGYQCDQQAGSDGKGRCCARAGTTTTTSTTAGTLGKCSWGADAVSACFKNSTHMWCGLPQYQCDEKAGNDSLGRCCLRQGSTTSNVLGKCSWGADAVSACFKNSTHMWCGLPQYNCDKKAGNSNGRCCLRQSTTGNLGECSWGADAVSGCFKNATHMWCGRPEHQCDDKAGNDGHGRCCLRSASTPAPSGMPKCRDGNEAMAGCISGKCGAGSVCSTSDNLCCRSGTSASCNFQSVPRGRCTNRQCALNEHCSTDDYCCPTTISTPSPNVGLPKCQDGNPSFAVCVNGQCGDGFTCSTSDNLCCLSGTKASCNFKADPTGRCPAGVCGPNEFCSQDKYCCPV